MENVLIAGLGNPGEKYEETRHNVGFTVLDKFKESYFKDEKYQDQFSGKLISAAIEQTKYHLLKPCTYMNNSGESIARLANYYKIGAENILVIHDEIDLPIGKYQFRKGAGHAGHKGVSSIIDHLGTKNFFRLRIGIGNDQKNSADEFVLKKFSKEEFGILNIIYDELIEKIRKFPAVY